jgi:hypothetical protein
MRTVDLLQEPSLSRPLREWRCTSARRQRLGRAAGCARTVRPRALHPTVASFGNFRVLDAVASCASASSLVILTAAYSIQPYFVLAPYDLHLWSQTIKQQKSRDKQPAGQRRKRDATQCGPAKAARSRQIALCYAHVWGHRCVGAVGRGTGWRPNSARIRSGLALHAGNSRRPHEKGPAASARDDTTVAVCSGGGRRDHRQPCVRKGGPNFRLVRTVLTSNGRCGRPPL